MTLFAVGLMLGLLAGMILMAIVVVVHLGHIESVPPWSSDTWTTTTETEYQPQRDERLDDLVDPRQTARDSATSARSKTFRG